MRCLFFLGVIIILAVLYSYFFRENVQPDAVVETPTTIKAIGLPSFAWSYSASEKDGVTQNEIYLTATYENGASDTRVIDTVEGGCNEYSSPDTDIYSGSTMIICYYAGLGHYFKVVSEADGYHVKRQVFEEASPEYNPPIQPFETVTRF